MTKSKEMKKVLPLLLFFFLAEQLTAQVGINTPAPDAQLDIRSSSQTAPNNKDGLLIPKINVFPAVNPNAAQNGMMVFLTTAVGTNLPGFYYWDNPTNSWKGIGNDNTKWGLTGNTGTNPAIHFIGTADNQDVVFKRSSDRAGFLGILNTSFGLNTMESISSGANNIAIGGHALHLNSTGNDNIAIGYNALDAHVTGSRNVAVGGSAMDFDFNSSENTAVGYEALRMVNGIAASGNVAVGHRAGSQITTGFNNIMIGANTNPQSPTHGNKLNIGNTIFGTMGTTKTIGINSIVPSAALEVSATDMGMLIPRIALTSAVVAAPVVNPSPGSLPVEESTLIYNTATAGVAPNNVTPGFYYWNTTKWIRFDVNGEQMPRYYFAKGTTNALPTSSMVLMPEMNISVVPKGNTVIVHFSAGGYATTSCNERTILFQVLLNNVVASQWQSSTEAGSAALPVWDTSHAITLAVTPNILQKISISWFVMNCTTGINQVATPSTTTPTLQAHRELMVIDPAGGAANIPSVTPVDTNNWTMVGNTSVNPAQHFVGTLNDADLIFKRNDVRAGRLGTNNTAFGTAAMPVGTGTANTAVGNMAIEKLTTGTNNTAVGSEALGDNTLGGNNTAVGRLALAGNVSGNFNTAVGSNALLNGGTRNTALGAQATASASLTNATALGANALVSASDALVLGAVDGQNGATTNTNVGIGITAPLSALHVSRGVSGATITANAQLLVEDDANVYQQFLTPTANESGLLFGNASGSIRSAIVFNNTTNTDGLQLRTGGNTTRVAINAIGDVGIGTTAPEADLEVSGTGEEVIRVSSTSTTGAMASIDLFRNGAGSFDWRLRNNGGELYFMRSDDDFATAPDEHYRMTTGYFRPIDNTKSLGLLASRWTAVFAVNGVIQTSDENDKQAIAPLTSGLDKIMNLKPVSFRWKDKQIDNSSEHLGFIAQEVQKVLPAVVVDSDWSQPAEGQQTVWQKSDRLGMKYVEVIPVLVKAMQEQQQTIESQNKKLSELNETNRKLQQQLETHDRQLQQILNRLSLEKK